LLSWLTAHAMKPIIAAHGTSVFIKPKVDDQNPLLKVVMRDRKDNDTNNHSGDLRATLACFPDNFAVLLPTESANNFKQMVVDSVMGEWKRIAAQVKKCLPAQMQAYVNSTNWDRQIESYFEIVCVVREDQGTAPDTKAWVNEEWEKLGQLLEMTRSVRHVPNYQPLGEKNKFPVKCSMFGSYEQIGPAEFEVAKKYWAGLTPTGNDEKPPKKWGKGFHGTIIQSSDKLCAVALVKRFMWAASLCNELDLDVRKLRFTDTATMAAKEWLAEKPAIDPFREWVDSEHWSGQWLHWETPEQDDDAKCPPSLWDRILDKKRAQPRPPTYYALMHLDGDNMGELFTGDLGPTEWGVGLTRYMRIANLVMMFSEQVQAIVKEYHGELIYVGGDDVLAFLPADEAIACATALHTKFAETLSDVKWPEGKRKPSLSGGIAVVHYKEDLRFALDQVRNAEKAAKHIGKKYGKAKVKDALALAICKRSGEHSTVVMGWEETVLLQDLVKLFAKGASDRWTYKLREFIEDLIEPRDRTKDFWANGQLLAMGEAETKRLIGRSDNATETFKGVITKLLEAYQLQMQKQERHWPAEDILMGFVRLCQSASFLARGKD